MTFCQRRNSYRGLKRNLVSLEEEELPTPSPSPPHPHLIRSHLKHTHHPPWPPNISSFLLCRARSPLFPYPTPLSLPPPSGGVVRPLHHSRSLGTTTTAVMFIVVVVVVLLLYWLSCWLSFCCCPSSRVVVVATAAAATAEPPMRSGRGHCRATSIATAITMTSPPVLVRRRLTFGLAVRTARQGATPWSLRHGREIWR